MGRHVKNRILDSGALTVQIPDITTDQRPAGIDGDIIFNKTTDFPGLHRICMAQHFNRGRRKNTDCGHLPG